MPLSKHYLDTHTQTITFEPEALGKALSDALPEVRFAVLMGSSVSGQVAPHSDVDIAFFTEGKVDMDFYNRVFDVCKDFFPGVRVDIGMLNGCEPVYGFEALKGRLLFCRDRETYLRFFSVTSREYKHQMFHYEKQMRYRMEARGEV
jgi:predicted nucleotidyltransferase